MKQNRANARVRKALFLHGMTQYELGKLTGESETTIYRRLRDELPEEEQDALVRKIEEAAKNDRG